MSNLTEVVGGLSAPSPVVPGCRRLAFRRNLLAYLGFLLSVIVSPIWYYGFGMTGRGARPPIMLDTETIEAILRLLATGDMTHSAIGLRVGVSQSTVNAIANGRRDPVRSRRLVRRCTECGAKVVPPCRVCKLRRDPPRRISRPDRDYPPLAIELDDPEAEQRYLRLRVLKMMAGEPYVFVSPENEDDDGPSADDLWAIEEEGDA